jgi:two-component system LytT family response regulator
VTAATDEIRVVVADDEAPARAKVRRLLIAEPGARVVGEAANGAETVRLIEHLAPDLVLLDGFGVVETVGPTAMPEVVFITAHDEHAVRAFEVHALDFVLKPVTPERFRTAFARVRARIIERRRHDASDDLANRLAALLGERSEPRDYLTRLLVEDGRAGLFVSVGHVDWVEANRNYVVLHVGMRRYTLRTPIGDLVARLDPSLFLRVNRSTVVRLDVVRAVHPWSHGDYRVELADGTIVTWSRRYRAQANGRFGPTA